RFRLISLELLQNKLSSEIAVRLD
ncbi:hypothetical protein A2U01_0053209, partial [Trifolium medium]|nr:hypothetical protein [Trifolium medium]